MSTLTPVYSFYFDGRRPSKAQVISKLLAAIKAGHTQIDISWGENMLEFGCNHGNWYGYGWIKGLGGQDLVRELMLKGDL